MPRHTHPAPRAKHPRDHTRLQARRWSARRWRQAKARYGYSWSAPLHPEIARRDPGRDDAYWPFTLSANELARNPFTVCSCWGCSVRPLARRQQRVRERRFWREDWADSRPAEAALRGRRHAGTPPHLRYG